MAGSQDPFGRDAFEVEPNVTLYQSVGVGDEGSQEQEGCLLRALGVDAPAVIGHILRQVEVRARDGGMPVHVDAAFAQAGVAGNVIHVELGVDGDERVAGACCLGTSEEGGGGMCGGASIDDQGSVFAADEPAFTDQSGTSAKPVRA